MEIRFDDLKNADLIIDCIYKSGPKSGYKGEPLHILLPKCGTASGFRKVSRKDNKKEMAYVVLFSTQAVKEWPDSLDNETGIFKYYGDNRDPDKEITNTKQGGNKLLIKVFSMLNLKDKIKDIPPFLVFNQTGEGRDVKFIGLAVPGNPLITPFDDLHKVKKTIKGKSFTNYEAYFTILDTTDKPISKKWLKALIEEHENNLKYAPKVWKTFIKKGREGIKALKKD